METWKILLVIALAILSQAFNIDLANNTMILLLLLLSLSTTPSTCCSSQSQLFPLV